MPTKGLPEYNTCPDNFWQSFAIILVASIVLGLSFGVLIINTVVR